MADAAAKGEGRLRPGRRAEVRYSAELGQRICERVAAGEPLYQVCRDDGMPSATAVRKWTFKRADFAEALLEARKVSGRTGNGGVWSYCAETADAIFERLCEGESMSSIARDPTMPCASTIWYWRRRWQEFEQKVQLGRQIQAEQFCDKGWEYAQAATPETAYLTQVRLGHLRWMAGVMAPKVYRAKPAEPDEPRRELTVLYRRFEIEVDEETGKRKVVSYCPNHETGEVERQDSPTWRRPEGVVLLPS